ncbi:phosphoribosyl-dephospho-CoA transferase [Labrys miyagiensis]|uniref:Phosphoribosyl-dephospho-CoA transferase n=1 Tax=Labrys miyagiensis TaxID=346912 RepID=A0ABQ6CMA4_9HYPH|nr:malonate decarboxylase holo-[acyl-carrier-protein] synthase [Labrys miyagiensis]GLS19829.1 phosphoribosyl-dephospho-CoA transferase [Labrys miyagiensis]
MTETLTRHTMVTPTAAAWAALLAARPDLAREPLLARWGSAGYPLVARRPAWEDDAGAVPLGLPLPPSQGKQRIAVSLKPGDIAGSARPPLLRDAASAAPAAWQASIVALLRLDPSTRCFGSLAWQHLTALAYVSDSSDLDLLWDLPDADGLDPLLDGIAAIERCAPMRIDGEILAAAGGANWRELWQRGEEILVKGRTEARLMARARFLAGERP